MAGITLYVDSNFYSPYAMACYIALVEKKLPFTLRKVDLDTGEHLLPAYRDISPTGRIPLMLHGDVALNESSAIIEYLDEVFPESKVLPRDVVQRAKARQVQAWIRGDLLALRAERTTVAVFGTPPTAPLSPAAQESAERLIGVAEKLIDGEHLFGDWSIADTDLALVLQRLIKSGDPVPERLAAYANSQWQRESVQAWIELGAGRD